MDAETVTIPFGAAAVNKVGLESQARKRTRIEPFELIFVGRLVRRKGVDVLLRAAQELKDDSRLRIRIIGGGPEKTKLEDLASRLGVSERVTFTGTVDGPTIDGFFRGCDALVLPAIVTETGETEGLGVVLLEAMGYGKPVIASAAGGIVDIVKDNETGLLVTPGDPHALALAIRRAMDEPEMMEKLARQGTVFADGTFGWDKIVGDLQGVYNSAIERRAKSHWRR
jgi:glycosyltransferase involved in cell wall biosynthesis